MTRAQRFVVVAIAIIGMFAGAASAASQEKGKDKGKDQGKDQGQAKGKDQGQAKGKDQGHAKHHEHQNGKQLVGEKIKTNGHHVIHTKGEYTTSVEVKGGKVAGVHVKHAKKGDIPVKKYKTNKAMAQRKVLGQADGFEYASFQQDQYLGTVYIGYAYVDEYGDEEIYWFPYDMILDGDTGAVEYVPAS